MTPIIPTPNTSAPFRDRVLQSQRRLFNAVGVEDGQMTEKSIHLRELGCSVNALVTAPPYQNAPVLFAVHGWGAGLGAWAFVLPELSKRYAVYLIDLPGMGGSDRCPHWKHDYGGLQEPQRSIEYFLQHFDAVYDALVESDPAFASSEKHLLAHSLGAYLSVLWVLRDSSRFSTLSLVSPVGVPERPSEGTSWEGASVVQRAIFGALKRLWALGVTPQSAVRKLPPSLGVRLVDSMTAKRYGHVYHDQELQALSDYLYEISRAPASSEQAVTTVLQPGAWARKPLVQLLPGLKCKTSFAYGELDWMDKSVAEALSPKMEDATVSVIPGGDHNMHMTAPASFVNFVLESAAC